MSKRILVIDDDKAGVKRYLMLIKNSSPPTKKMIDKIINLTMEKKGKNINVEVESGGLLHGIYDWMIVFSAVDYKEVNKFSEMFMLEYNNMIKKMEIIELIFPIKKYGLINPNLERLSEYF